MEATSDIPTQTPAAAFSASGPEGLGGWLLLPIFYLISTIVLTSYDYSVFLSDWEYMIALVTGQVGPDWLLWSTLLSTVMAVELVAFAIYLLVVLFQKKRQLPRLMVWFYSAQLIVMGIEFQISVQYSVSTQTPGDLGEAGKGLIHAILMVAIWIPYFLRSKRVKATFVN
jgi:hypothetical protein